MTVGLTSRRSADCAGAKARIRSPKPTLPITITSTSLLARSVPAAMLPYTNAIVILLPSASSASRSTSASPAVLRKRPASSAKTGLSAFAR
jgi:hypothetical protein